MSIDRFRLAHRISPLTVVLLVVIDAVCAAGGLAIFGLFLRVVR